MPDASGSHVQRETRTHHSGRDEAALGAGRSPAQLCPLSSGLPARPARLWSQATRLCTSHDLGPRLGPGWVQPAKEAEQSCRDRGVSCPFTSRFQFCISGTAASPHRRCQQALSLGCGVPMDSRARFPKVLRVSWSRWSPASGICSLILPLEIPSYNHGREFPSCCCSSLIALGVHTHAYFGWG